MMLDIVASNTSGWNQTLFDVSEWFTETVHQLLLGNHGMVLGCVHRIKRQRGKGQMVASTEGP